MNIEARRRITGIISLVAVVALLLASAISVSMRLLRDTSPPPPMETLIAAAIDMRPVEGRLSGGFQWAPFRQPTRGDRTIDNQRLIAAASSIFLELENVADDSSKHTAAIAGILAGKVKDADTLLSKLPRNGSNARIRNDAAVAKLARAITGDRPMELPFALAEADRALREQPRLPEALFNRAVILERLGLYIHAAKAWQTYLTVDPTSPWATEARERLARLERATVQPDGRKRAGAAEEAAVRGDDSAVLEYVSELRQFSRGWTEVEVLGQWAEATKRHDETAATRSLIFARAVGKALSAVNGETLIADAVSAIDHATGDRRSALIDGHSVYREARLLYVNRHAAEALPLLERAARLLAQGESPVTYMARYYAASALYDQGYVAEARRTLRELAATPAARRYKALDASLHWELGLCEDVDGSWSAALDAYERAANGFAALGERGPEGFVRSLLAGVYDSIGDRDEAWRGRVDAFRLLSEQSMTNRLHVAIAEAARDEVGGDRAESALALLQVEIEEAKRSASRETLVGTYTSRAMVCAKTNERPAALRDLEQARSVAATINDVRLREQADTTIAVAEATLLRDDDPMRAIVLLDDAVKKQAAGRRYLLPRTHLERARTLRRLGLLHETKEALTAGINELERERSSIGNMEQRTGALDAGEALFTEAVELLAREGSYAEAFEYAERWRARTLFDNVALRAGNEQSTSLPAVDVRKTLPAGTVILEYALIENGLLLFAISRDRFETFTIAIDREQLRERIERFALAVRNRAPQAEVLGAAAAAHDVLLAPAANIVRDATTLVFVPDRFLQTVPYPALFDRSYGRYVIEDHAVAVSPSARLLLTLRTAERNPVKMPVLIFGDPATGGEFERLASSNAEARAIATFYPRATIALGSSATRERFLHEWGEAAIVHFAGHASNAPARGASAALALAGMDEATYLHAHEIARMTPSATRLVVLAACDTFTGTREHLEGTPTLAHAFLAAGVQTVAGTLWPIDDDGSRELFIDFHRFISRGTEAAVALRQAQLASLRSADERLRHPASWSGVEILGNPWLTIERN